MQAIMFSGYVCVQIRKEKDGYWDFIPEEKALNLYGTDILIYEAALVAHISLLVLHAISVSLSLDSLLLNENTESHTFVPDCCSVSPRWLAFFSFRGS